MYTTGIVAKSSYRKYLFYKPVRELNNIENPKRALDLGTEVIGICELPSVGAGNRIWVLCKCVKFF